MYLVHGLNKYAWTKTPEWNEHEQDTGIMVQGGKDTMSNILLISKDNFSFVNFLWTELKAWIIMSVY